MSNAVRLSLPAGSDLLVLARYTAATLAARAEFDIEEIEDLRLAVDELCLSVIDGAGSGTVELVFTQDGATITITCSLEGAGSGVANGNDYGSSHGDGADVPSSPGSSGVAEAPGAPGAVAAVGTVRIEAPDDLSIRLIEALVDEYGQEADGTRRQAWLSKRGNRIAY